MSCVYSLVQSGKLRERAFVVGSDFKAGPEYFALVMLITKQLRDA